MTHTAYPASWYAATRRDDPQRPAAEGLIETGVCVVGGGFAGLHIARLLAQQGLGVVLLERQRIGWGASGRNGGFVGAGFAKASGAIIARVGIDKARALHALSRRGVALVRAAADAGDDHIIMGTGKLSVCRTDQGPDHGSRSRALAARLGTSFEPWSIEQVRDVARTRRYFQGLHDPEAFQVHPLNLALALARQIEAAGGLVFEASEATGLAADGAGWQVTTGSGATVRARHAVLAGNADLGKIHGRVARAVLPVATYVAVTEKLGSRLDDALRWGGAVSDTRRAGDYYRIVDGDRLLWGGRITTDTREPPRLRAMMKADILAVYPQLGDVAIAYAWPGVMGYAPHMMPHVGKLGEGLWVSSAFGGHGVAQTAAAAEVVASGIAEGDARWRMFEPWPVHWAGGLAGRAATQCAYWWMQARDRLEER